MAYVNIGWRFSLLFIFEILIYGYNCSHLKDKSNCRDVYIWIADGSVDCKYLEQSSNYGVHKKAKYYCTKYSLTDCCDTCTRLGFKKGGEKPSTKPSREMTTAYQSLKTTVSQSTIAPTTKAPTTITQSVKDTPNCRDFGVWIASGLAPCKYLQKKSFWGIHKKADYYCNKYSLTWCCRTCANINNQKFNNVVSVKLNQ